jgi:hypothetical protein
MAVKSSPSNSSGSGGGTSSTCGGSWLSEEADGISEEDVSEELSEDSFDETLEDELSEALLLTEELVLSGMGLLTYGGSSE